MIRIIANLFLFIVYGNFNFVLNDIVLLSLINVAFFTTLKEKKIKSHDIFIFIITSFIIDILIGLPILIGTVFLLIPILLLSYLINNYNLSIVIKTLIIFLLSFITFCFFDNSIIFRLLNFQYLLILFIISSVFLGLLNFGKK